MAMSRVLHTAHFTDMKQRSDRFLIWAIAISLALHVVFVLGVRYERPAEAKEQVPQQATIDVVVHTPPPPTPTPPPAVTAPQSTAQRPNDRPPHVNAPVTASTSGPAEPPGSPGPESTDGSGVGNDLGSPGPSAAPTDTPKPACSTPEIEATAADVVEPVVPEGVEGVNARAQVRVTLSPAGTILGVAIFSSTGDARLDNAALRAARESTYHAEIRDCVAIGGSYLFTVDFDQ